MSFGFQEPIPLIDDAIKRATKAKKVPLFFAATGNNGAHQGVAWPANDLRVIGINSTTAQGVASTFNPRRTNDAYPIFYAFGEGVRVITAKAGNPEGYEIKHVSGTSYATPVAAALVASLLWCVKMLQKCNTGEQARFARLPRDLQDMDRMVKVLSRKMQRKHDNGQKSILPWELFELGLQDGCEFMKDVSKSSMRDDS